MPMPDLVIYHVNIMKNRDMNDNIDIEVEIDRNDMRINVEEIAVNRGIGDYVNKIAVIYIRANGNNNEYDHTTKKLSKIILM